MAAKLLHSLTDDNIELQKQIGCMNGIFQLFDRQHILTGAGRRVVAHSPKRLPPGISDISSESLERESNSANLRSASSENYSYKNVQEKQRISSESSRASFSSLSRSSSFSSLDCNNRATQLEPASFDRIIFPESPSKDPTMSLQSLSPQFSRQSRDLRDLVKDSMYRDIQGLPVKPKASDKKDSTRAHSEITNDKLQEAPWFHNEPRTLLRSSSYHSKDGSSFSVSRDAPRFSYDGREASRALFDSRDVSKSTLKLKDLPRLSLDSKAGAMRSLRADSKANFLKSNSGDSDVHAQNQQQTCGYQRRPPSVVAKLMGLETLPDSVCSVDKDKGSDNISKSFAERDTCLIQLSSPSTNSRKEPSSPSWRNPDSSMKPMARFPIEPAPWKQIDGRRSPQKPTKRAPAKGESTLPSVYSEIEKRLTDLEFAQSGKDLRALKQILDAMQSKGFLKTQKEVAGSNFDHDEKHFSSRHEARSVDHRRPQSEQVLASTKRRTLNMESPIVIMKPAKHFEKSVPKLQDNEFLDNKKGPRSGRTAKDLGSKFSHRDNAVNSASTRNDRTQRTTQTSTRSQNLGKDGNVGLGKSSGSISPRMQQKKLELERKSRPPTPPDSSKTRRQSSKQQGESNSPGGRRGPKHPIVQESGDKLSEVNVESRNSNSHENENSIQPNSSVVTSEKSPGVSRGRILSANASEFMLSGLVEKSSSMAMSEEESADFGIVPLEYSSPVSVLDNVVHKDDSPSPVKYTLDTFQVDVSADIESVSDEGKGSSVDIYISNSKESGTSEMNQKKLQNIENLVQKLKNLNSSHDEARTDYIASLCENTDPDNRYISEILLASGLLLRDLSSSLVNFQFHPSGHPINPELFFVLEQTKASTLLEEEDSSPKKKTQLMIKEKSHRKLIFDTVNEILARKLGQPGPFSEPWLRPLKRARQAHNAQKLLRELCYEIEALQAMDPTCSSNEENERWKAILCKDVMHEPSESWIKFDEEISGAVLDIERSIFKDLVNEIVIGESSGLKTKAAGRRRLFTK